MRSARRGRSAKSNGKRSAVLVDPVSRRAPGRWDATVDVACCFRRTARIAATLMGTRAAVGVVACGAAFGRGGTAVVVGDARADTLRRTSQLSKTERSQNRAREPSEDELQCARSRHRCGKSTANLIIKFRHVSP